MPNRYEARDTEGGLVNRLILLRHAKAEAEAASGDDFDRPLAARGRREAQAVAEHLAGLGLRPDVAVVSPALRTRETWEALNAVMPGGEIALTLGIHGLPAPDL